MVLPVGVLSGGGERRERGAFGGRPVHVDVPPLDPQVPVVRELLHHGHGLVVPLGTERALVVGEHDEPDRGVDRAEGEGIVGFASFGVRVVGLVTGDGPRAGVGGGGGPGPEHGHRERGQDREDDDARDGAGGEPGVGGAGHGRFLFVDGVRGQIGSVVSLIAKSRSQPMNRDQTPLSSSSPTMMSITPPKTWMARECRRSQPTVRSAQLEP